MKSQNLVDIGNRKVKLISTRTGEILECRYRSAEASLHSECALLPFNEQPEGFRRSDFEAFLKESPSYPIWQRASLISRYIPAIMPERSKERAIMISKSLNTEQTIFLRPLFLGFSLKEIISTLASFLIGVLTTQSWPTLLMKAAALMRILGRH